MVLAAVTMLGFALLMAGILNRIQAPYFRMGQRDESWVLRKLFGKWLALLGAAMTVIGLIGMLVVG